MNILAAWGNPCIDLPTSLRVTHSAMTFWKLHCLCSLGSQLYHLKLTEPIGLYLSLHSLVQMLKVKTLRWDEPRIALLYQICDVILSCYFPKSWKTLFLLNNFLGDALHGKKVNTIPPTLSEKRNFTPCSMSLKMYFAHRSIYPFKCTVQWFSVNSHICTTITTIWIWIITISPQR